MVSYPKVLVERQALAPQRTWPRLYEKNAVAFTMIDVIGNQKFKEWLW